MAKTLKLVLELVEKWDSRCLNALSKHPITNSHYGLKKSNNILHVNIVDCVQ